MVKKANAASLKADKSSKLVEIIINGIQEKKGKDIVSINLKSIDNAVCDYFVICHGDSTRQVDAIANSIEEEVKKIISENVWHKEGYGNAQWILLDYIDVVVHVFEEQTREFYNLEGLWADAEIRKLELEY